jgi:hypothetical protein
MENSSSEASNNTPQVVALVRDLLFSSRIAATARATNVRLQIVRDAQQLQKIPAGRLLVDLNQPGAIDAAVAWKNAHGRRVIGFVSHVDAATIAAARAAGIEEVLARSQFVARLEELLR